MNKISSIPKLSTILTISAFSILLAACGASAPVKPAPPKPEPSVKSEPNFEGKPTGEGSAAKPESAKPDSATTKPGGYYLDDGPEDNPPENLDSVADAVPRAEPLLARANKPYYAFNISYQPMTEYAPYKKRGLASWYGKRYHGQKTSTGEVYDMYMMTGAHTILPIPSYARVTNLTNKKSVVVRINDRGPFHSDRIIDLSYVAAYKLGLLSKGSGMVEVEAIDTRSMPNATSNAVATQEKVALETTNSTSPDTTIAPLSVEGSTVPQSQNAVKGSFVQVGAFKVKKNGDELLEKLVKDKLAERNIINNWYNEGTYRVRLGPFANKEEAERTAAKIKSSLKLNTYIINQP